MRYRGFNVYPTFDAEIKRYNDTTQKVEDRAGFSCEVYAGDHKPLVPPLDSFSLAVGYEIPDGSYDSIAEGLRKYVDDNFLSLKAALAEQKSENFAEKLSRAIVYIKRFDSCEELYSTLQEKIGLSDDEIREIGFASLAPYFDKKKYAQTIAEYLIDVGTEDTTTGNYHIGFDEVNKRFGVSLPDDKELLENIVDSLDKSIVADIDTENDFDLIFYLNYCPMAEGEEEESMSMKL